MIPQQEKMDKIYNKDSKFEKSQMFKLEQVLKMSPNYHL